MRLKMTLLSASVLALTACGGGSGGGASPQSTPVATPAPATPAPATTAAPTMSFDTARFTIPSGDTQGVFLSATAEAGYTTGPTVTCTNGGDFASNRFTAPNVVDETTVVCTAEGTDAENRTASASFTATVQAAPSASSGLNGSAFKGLVLGGYVSIADAAQPDTPIITGRTATDTGLFDLDVAYSLAAAPTYLKVTVSGGEGASMICDAATGCAGTAFGNPVALADDFSLSAVVPTPDAGDALSLNINMMTDLTAALLDETVDMSTRDDAQAQTLRIFGLDGVDLDAVRPVELGAEAEGDTQDGATLSLLSGGLMQSLYETSGTPGAAMAQLRTRFAANAGEIIAREATDDAELISLDDIYGNASALSAVFAADSDAVRDALATLQAETVAIQTTALVDTLTASGTWLSLDVTAPVVSFERTLWTVRSGETQLVPALIEDLDPTSAVSAATCRDGTYDIATGLYTTPGERFLETSDICTVTVTDTAGNSGEGTFSVTVTPAADTVAPTLTFTPATLNLGSGETAVVTTMAVDTVGPGPVGETTVTCVGEGGSFAEGVFTASSVTAEVTTVCTASASDGAGNVGTATLEVVTTPMLDTTAPTIELRPTVVFVASGETSSASITATDLSGAEITSIVCTDGITYADGVVTAPDVTAPLRGSCVVTAVDPSGNTATANLIVSVTYVDTVDPVISFTPSDITILSETSTDVVLAATDNVGIKGDVGVSCTNGGRFENNVFTAFSVTSDLVSVCTATATDEAGNTATATLTATMTAPILESEPPVLELDTTVLTVASEGSVDFPFTATDNVGVTDTFVRCRSDNGVLSYRDGRLYAAFTPEPIMAFCDVIVRDAAFNRTSKTRPVNITATPDEPPQLTFTPAAISLASEGSATVTLSAVDRHTLIATGPDVTCTDGVTFVDGVVTAPAITADIEASCTATATDDAGLSASKDLAVSIQLNAPAPVIRGTVTYQNLKAAPTADNPAATFEVTEAARAGTVEILDAQGEVISTASIDVSGAYAAPLPTTEPVTARVAMEIRKPGADAPMVTFANRFDAMPRRSRETEAVVSTGLVTEFDIDINGAADDFSRDSSAQLAALSTIRNAITRIEAAVPDVTLPALLVRTEYPSTTLSARYGGSVQLGASHYTTTASDVRTVYLGAEDDLWEPHVVMHHFGHYIEDSLGRFDSPYDHIGNPVDDVDRLVDVRVAFSEGFANAFAGAILNDPVYRDRATFTEGFTRTKVSRTMNLDTDASISPGWFNIRSIQNVLYDLYDDTNEDFAVSGFTGDRITGGLPGLLTPLMDARHKNAPTFATIFSFREAQIATSSDTPSLYGVERINGVDAYATDETTAGPDPLNVPVFTAYDETQTLCSNLIDTDSQGHDLGIAKHIAFDVETAGTVSFTAVSATQFGASVPEMILYTKGQQVERTFSNDPFGDVMVERLEAGPHVVTVFDNDNFLGSTGRGSICIDTRISR